MRYPISPYIYVDIYIYNTLQGIIQGTYKYPFRDDPSFPHSLLTNNKKKHAGAPAPSKLSATPGPSPVEARVYGV